MSVPCSRAFATLAELDAHLRQHHPDVVDEVDRWPDGGLAGHHVDPTPEHITGGAA